MTAFHIESKELQEDTLLITISGEGNFNSARELHQELQALAIREDHKVIVDLSALDYLASLFLGYLVQFQGTLMKRDCPVILIGVCPKILETLELANLSKRFVILDDLPSALQYHAS